MSTVALRKALSALPDDAQVPVRWVREKLEQDGGEDGPAPRVDTNTAARIMAKPKTTARALARRCWNMQREGLEPPVRVWADMTEAGRVVRWWYDERDCWRVRRDGGGGPRLLNTGTDGGEAFDERDATVKYWGEVAVGDAPPIRAE